MYVVCKCDHSIGIGCGCDKMKVVCVHKTQNYFYFGKKLQYLSYFKINSYSASWPVVCYRMLP